MRSERTQHYGVNEKFKHREWMKLMLENTNLLVGFQASSVGRLWHTGESWFGWDNRACVRRRRVRDPINEATWKLVETDFWDQICISSLHVTRSGIWSLNSISLWFQNLQSLNSISFRVWILLRSLKVVSIKDGPSLSLYSIYKLNWRLFLFWVSKFLSPIR